MKKFSCILIFCVLVLLCACSQQRYTQARETENVQTTASTVKVTFQEGLTAFEIAQKLEENEVCKASDFINEVMQSEKLKEQYKFLADFDSSNKAYALEGYIFPDTYEFYKGESASSALSRFLKNTESKLTDEMYERAKELGYTMDEIITLASVVQSESGFINENAKVSSVLHNRIESKDYGKLQCDVTVNYLNKFVLSSEYLSGDTERFKELYNTYKCTGLPAGAICNPGLEAIKAALYPEKTNYFFFVTDEEKNYYYAETYEEHLQNCKLCGIE